MRSMRFKNKTENDLVVGGRFVKAGETFESSVLIENPNFEMVDDVKPQIQTPPAQPSGVPPMQAAQIPGQQPASAEAATPTVQPTNPGDAK
jgi:acetate kinase